MLYLIVKRHQIRGARLSSRRQALGGIRVDCLVSYQLATAFSCGSISPRWAWLTVKISDDHAWIGLISALVSADTRLF